MEVLKPGQEMVLDRLLAGDTVTAAAVAAGVDRSSVHRWFRSDAHFRAAWNRRRRELRDAAAARLMSLARRALDVIEKAVEAGDTGIALAVLRGAGLITGTPEKIGAETPEAQQDEIFFESLASNPGGSSRVTCCEEEASGGTHE
jgi:hypothetical protein